MNSKIISISHFFDKFSQENLHIDIQQEVKQMLVEEIAKHLIETRQDLFTIKNVNDSIKELNFSCCFLSKEEFNLLQYKK